MSQRLARILTEARVIREDDLGLVFRSDDARPLAERVASLGLASEDAVAGAIAAALGLPMADLAAPEDGTGAIGRVPRTVAERHLVLPLAVRGRRLELAMVDPLDVDAVRDVEFVTGLGVRPLVAAPSRIRAAIARAYGLGRSMAPLLDALGAGSEGESLGRETMLDLDAPDD